MRGSIVAVLALSLVAAGCDEDDPFEPPPATGPIEVTFTYTPHAETPNWEGPVDVRGSFNNWGGDGSEAFVMTQSGGTWSVTVELDPDTYQFKYTFGGDWADNMCASETWGNPPGGPIRPGQTECEDDGFGGMNAVIVVAH